MRSSWLGFVTVVSALLCVYFLIAGAVVDQNAYSPAEDILGVALYLAAGAAGLITLCGFIHGGNPSGASSGGSHDVEASRLGHAD